MKRVVFNGFIVLSLVFLICLVLINRFVDQQQQQSLQHWQTTLSALADNQSLNVSRWIFTNEAPLKELTQNNAVQLYLQRLSTNSSAEQEGNAQRDYLRNLVVAVADREGFKDTKREAVNANVRIIANSSLAIYDANLKIVAATPGLPNLSTEVTTLLETKLKNGTVYTSKIWLNENNIPQISFIAPLSGLASFGSKAERAGYIIGTKNVDKEVFGMLRNFSINLPSLESALLQASSKGITYASPLHSDNLSSLVKSVPTNADVAAAIAFENSSMFIQNKDYQGRDVLAVSRDIADSELKLIIKVNRDEALGQSLKQQKQLQTILFLGTAALLAMLVGAGWYGHLLREQKANEELTETTLQLSEKTALLDAINDNVSDMVLIVDQEQKLLFINKALANKVASDALDTQGKGLKAVLGSDYAEQLSPLIASSFTSDKQLDVKRALELQGQDSIFMINLSPMLYGNTNAVMLHFHDITELEAHQQKQTRLLHQIMQSLMNAIDLHDPYSANHSQKAVKVAKSIAEAMSLSESDVSTVEIAANLCNLGKLSIPKDLLTKTSSLTEEEKALLHKEVDYAKEILSDIEFEGPVLETIIHKHEYLDGSGRLGLDANSLPIHTRILTVANDFVAMISPRAYREKLPKEEALQQMLNDADTRYDRQVIASLFHVVENKIDL